MNKTYAIKQKSTLKDIAYERTNEVMQKKYTEIRQFT